MRSICAVSSMRDDTEWPADSFVILDDSHPTLNRKSTGLGWGTHCSAVFFLVLHDGGEGVGLEAGAADQCAVDLFLAAERGSVVGLHAATVENAHL